MKRSYLLLLLGLLAGGLLGRALLVDPGYVLISWQGWALESSLWTALLVSVLAILLVFVLLQVLLRLLNLPDAWQLWWGRRRQDRALKQLEQGSDALESGLWARAERLLGQAAGGLDRPLTAQLLAARAAAGQGAMSRAQAHLNQAAEQGHRLAAGLARARLQLDGGEWEQAAINLRSLHAQYGRQVEVIKLLLQSLSKLGRWGEIAELLPSLHRHAPRQDSKAWSLERHAHEKVLAFIAGSGTRINRDFTERRLRDYWQALPRRLRQEPSLLSAYAEALIKIDHDDLAFALLREQLHKQWQPAWIDLFGRCRSTQPAQALEQARVWQKEHPNDALLLRALARLCLQNRLFSEARGYLESSLQLARHPETYAEMIRLLVRMNDHQAQRYLIEGLQLMSGNLPDLPLP